MADWQRQSRPTLGLAALLSLLLVQTAFSVRFSQTRISLSPRVIYHSFGSIVGAVLTGSHHIAGDLELLYEIRQLATQPPQSENSIPASPSSAPSSSTKEMLCEYRAIPVPNMIDE